MLIMDTTLYKKKTFKYTKNEVSRKSRHAETLKVRESSRFKRLSMLRLLDEDTDNENKPIEVIKQEEKKMPPSRFEMLMKWKKEKLIKKELDKKNNNRPFYVGGQSGKSNSNMDLSSVAKPNMRFDSSRIAKSRLVPPSQSAKIGNTTKQQTSGTSFQSSKIPNNSKLNGVKAASESRGYVVSSKNSKTFGNSTVANVKQNRVKSVNDTKANVVSSKNSKTSTVSNVKQVSALPKPTFSKQPNKAVKTGIPTVSSNLRGISTQIKNQTGIPTVSSNLRGISSQKIKNQVASRLAENISNKKTEVHSTTVSNKVAGKKGASKAGLEKKVEEKSNGMKIHKEELLPEQDLKKESFFDCSISIIKQTPSFAPANFKFFPPVGLPDFSTGDEAFETIKANFISRTSTPSKPCQEPSIPVVEVACNDPPLTDNLNPLPKMLISASPIVKLPADKEDNLPSEEKNIINASFDLNKIKELLLEHIKLTEDGNENLVNRRNDTMSPKVLEAVCTDSPLDIIDLNKIERLSINKELEVLEEEGSVNDLGNVLKKEDKCTNVSQNAHIDSPLQIIDLNKIERLSINKKLEVLQEEELINDDLHSQQDQDKYTEKKLSSAPTKRASMLKNVPVLNSIAETAEPDEHITHTSEIKQSSSTTRHSQRLSKMTIVEKNSDSSSAVTPRRSLRLQNITARKCRFEESETFSPKSKSNIRRSMRLIDLNTPDKETADSASKTNITADFERLCLIEPENINPHACLLDFECSPVIKSRSKKISLLYSPEKTRKSMRKSIRGDLMSFSPSN